MFRVGRFLKDQNGAVVLIFAIMAGVLILAAGVAIDASRARDTQQKMQEAADAAALAGARSLQDSGSADQNSGSDDQNKTAALNIFNANMPSSGGFALSSVDVSISPDHKQVGVNATGSIKTILGKFASVDEMSLSANATAQITPPQGGTWVPCIATATRPTPSILAHMAKDMLRADQIQTLQQGGSVVVPVCSLCSADGGGGEDTGYTMTPQDYADGLSYVPPNPPLPPTGMDLIPPAALSTVTADQFKRQLEAALQDFYAGRGRFYDYPPGAELMLTYRDESGGSPVQVFRRSSDPSAGSSIATGPVLVK